MARPCSPPRLWRSCLVVALAAARRGNPRAPGEKKRRPSFVPDNHARPVFYFHIPGTGGSTMEFAVARYACKMGLEMNSVYKGAEPICDVGAAHVSLATLQAWRAPRPTGLRATQVRDPAGHALKENRKWYGLAGGDAKHVGRVAGLALDVQYVYATTSAFAPNRTIAAGRDALGAPYEAEARLTIDEALAFLGANFDVVGTVGVVPGDYDAFVVHLGLEAAGRADAFPYSTVHDAGPMAHELDARLMPAFLDALVARGVPRGCLPASFPANATTSERLGNCPWSTELPADVALANAALALAAKRPPPDAAARAAYAAARGAQICCATKDCSHQWRAWFGLQAPRWGRGCHGCRYPRCELASDATGHCAGERPQAPEAPAAAPEAALVCGAGAACTTCGACCRGDLAADADAPEAQRARAQTDCGACAAAECGYRGYRTPRAPAR